MHPAKNNDRILIKRSVALLLACAVGFSGAASTALAEEPSAPSSTPTPSASNPASPSAPSRGDDGPSPTPAEEVEVERGADTPGFEVTDAAGGVIITGPGGVDLANHELVIPKAIDGKPVVGIGDGAFRGKGLTKLSFEPGTQLQSIGAGAFQGNNLTGELTIAAGTIGENAFAQNQLTGVTLNGTTTVDADAFRDNRLSSVTFAPSAGQTVTLGDRAFINNRLTGELDLTKVGQIGSEAFSTNELRTAKVGQQTTLGSGVFKENNAWVKIDTPTDVPVNESIVTVEYESGFGQVVDAVTVVVRHLDENGTQILPDETLGADLSEPGQKFQRGQQANYAPKTIQGYELQTPAITFTPDKDGFVIEANYKKLDNKPVFSFPEGGISLRNGETVTADRVKRGVTARAKDGTDLTGEITVDASAIDTQVHGFYDVVFSVTDAAGNEAVETRKVSVGTNWGEYEFGGGWQIKDFEYSYGRVQGFSASGRAKLEAGNTTLWIPPVDMQGRPVTSIKDDAFKRKGLTGIGGSWQNIRSISGNAFSGNSLQVIPDSWGEVRSIGYSAFSGNEITQLPDSWGNITELPAYGFERNKIAAIPDSWGNIVKIGDQALRGNRIEKLPDSWGEVAEIGNYALINNPWSEIPESWGKVKKIKQGAFNGQRLKELPEDWGSVEEIGFVAFSNNELTTLPTTWGSLKYVGSSAFSNNRIQEIPDNWSDWTRIPNGIFTDNQIATLPENWGNVTAIGGDAFWKNKITAIPESWGNVREIGGSAFSTNQLTEIPETWENVEKLGSRAFERNRITSVPDSWGKVDEVPYLGFGYNRLSQIPDSWGQVKTIGGFAFTGNSINKFPDEWGSVTTLATDAFQGTSITSLPASWGNIKSIGRNAFATSSLKNYTNTTFEIPTENLTQSFLDGLNGSALPKTITLFTTDGVTPPGLTVPPGIKVNPVKVTVRLVDEQGNLIGPKTVVLEGQMSAPLSYDPPAIYGYATPATITSTLGKEREQHIEVVYRKLPDAEVPADTNIKLSHNNKNPYLIGSDMTGNVRIDRTGYATETLRNVRVRFDLDPSVYDLDSFDITTSSLGINRDTIVRDGSSVSFIVPAINPSLSLTIPFRVRFNKLQTPSNTDFPILVTLVGEDGKAVAQSNVETFQGYYPMPSETIKVPGEDTRTGEIANYDQTVNEDDPENPVTYVSDNVPGQDVKNKVTYDVCVNGLERNVGDYTISVPVPLYKVHPKSANYQATAPTRRAEFDPAKNPGWKLSEDKSQLIFTGHNRDSRTSICKPLVLGYPGAVEWEKFALSATATMTPTGKPQAEPYIVTSATHANYFGRSAPPPGKVFDKKATGNHGSPSNNYFYDNSYERNGQFGWAIGYNFEQRAEQVIIRDFGLDERMYYDTLELPSELGEVEVKVFDSRGATLFTRTVYTWSSPRSVTFEKNQVIDAAELRIEPRSTIPAKTQGSIQLTSRLKEPSTVIFEQQPEASKVFKNSASVEANGAELGTAQAAKTVRPHKQEIAAFKTQRALSEQGVEVTNLITGDLINYTVGFTPNESFAETITNIEVVDLLPMGIDLDSVAMTAEFAKLPGAHYEVVEDYLGSGHTAVIFRASSATRDLIRPTARFTAGLVQVKINLALSDKHLVNDVFVKAQNTGLSNNVTDARLGDDQWSKAMQETTFEPAAAMETTKRIRTYDEDGKAGPWLPTVTTTPGAKLDYRLRLTNGTDRERKNLVVYDVFPHVGDQGIPKQRQSQFANDYDPTREPTLPQGYSISYYNGAEWPVYDGSQQQTEEVLSRLNWEPAPSKQTKAVRIVQDGQIELGSNHTVDFVLPFTANAERLDAHGNPPEDLLGKRAYNTFFYQDSMQPELLEGARVENLLKARPISIRFKKVKKGTQEPVAGAIFELRNSNDGTVATAVSDAQGIVHFPNVAVLAGYRIVETKAPIGFEINPQELLITDKQLADGYAKKPAVIELAAYSNAPTPPPPVYGKVEFKKLNPEGKPLPGTVFKLTGYDEKRRYQSYTAIAAADGTVGFGNVSPGKRYELVEERPVTPYRAINPISGVVVKGQETTYLGTSFTHPTTGETVEHVILNDRARLPLFKLGVTDDRALDAAGRPRPFGSFGNIDGRLLSGSQFELLDGATDDVVATIRPNTSTGYPNYVDNLEFGKLYKLREVTTPEGYEKIPGYPDVFEFKISTSGQVTNRDGEPFPIQSGLYVPNRQMTQTSIVTVKKMDQDLNALPGAEFALEQFDAGETDPAQAWKQVAVSISDADGVAAFADVTEGRYRVVEKQAPAGHAGRFVSSEFIVQRTVAKTFQFNAVNTRLKPSVAKIEYIARGLPNQAAAFEVRDSHPGSSVIRRNGAWEVVKYLSGATFELREGDQAGPQIEEVTTGPDGKADITAALDPNKTYVLVEKTAPEGYSVPEIPVTFTPAVLMQFEPGKEPGMFTVYAPNVRETGRIVVSKTNESTGQPVLGKQATFTAQRVTKVTDGSEQAKDLVIDGARYRPQGRELTEKTTASSGVAIFNKLPYGTYVLRETQAPRGYQLDPASAVIELNADEASYTHVFANKPLDPKIKVTKFINDHDANTDVTAAWLQPNADQMNVKVVVENAGNTGLSQVTVTDVIDGVNEAGQYINAELADAKFTVTNPDGTTHQNVANGQIELVVGAKAETVLTVASPGVGKMHKDTATATGEYDEQTVSDDDPAHAYRLPAPLPLPMSGDRPWLFALLASGATCLALSLWLAGRTRRRS